VENKTLRIRRSKVRPTNFTRQNNRNNEELLIINNKCNSVEISKQKNIKLGREKNGLNFKINSKFINNTG